MKDKIQQITEYLKYTKTGYLFLPLAVYVLLILSNLINTFLLDRSNILIIVFLMFSLALPAVIWFFIRENKRFIPSLRINLPKKEHIIPLVLSFIFLASGSIILNMIFIGENYIDFSMYNAFAVERDQGFFNILYTVLSFAILPAILEEFIFRGILCAELERGGTLCAVCISSLFFSFLNFSFAKAPVYFFAGIVLSIILYATDSVICSAILHVAYNLFAIFAQPLFVSFKDVSANVELFVFLALIVMIVSLIFLLSQLSRLYRKYSIKNIPSDYTRPIPLQKIPNIFGEILLSVPAICCYAVFLIASIILLI